MWSRAFQEAAAKAADELAALVVERAEAPAELVVGGEAAVRRAHLRCLEPGQEGRHRSARLLATTGPLRDLVWCHKLELGAATELAEQPVGPAETSARDQARIALALELATSPAAPAVSVIGRVLVIVLELATNPEREIALVSAIGRVQELVIALELATDLG
jgi:hypothetical protein